MSFVDSSAPEFLVGSFYGFALFVQLLILFVCRFPDFVE